MNAPNKLSTIDDAIKEDRYEIVNGQQVELPPMSAREVNVASILVQLLGAFVRLSGLGRVVGEMLFHLGDNQPERRPDVAFVSAQRWPLTRLIPFTNAWDVVPELAIEVVSPSNTWNEITTKIDEYFSAGVSRVWVVVTATERVYVYESPTVVQILNRDEDLVGDPILPGFRLPLAQLFEHGTV
ncbi:MAG: Uma2 family endonuclease [Gemmataceae bacterium]